MFGIRLENQLKKMWKLNIEVDFLKLEVTWMGDFLANAGTDEHP